MQVDVGNNKILDNYRPIATSPVIQALHSSQGGEKAFAHPQSSSGRSFISASASSEAEEQEGAPHHHKGHRHRRHVGYSHSQSPNSGNRKAHHQEGVRPAPELTPHHTRVSPGRQRQTPLAVAKTIPPFSLPPKPCVLSSPYRTPNSGIPPASRRYTSRDSSHHMNGDRASGAVGGSGSKRTDVAHHRSSSQNVEGASDGVANGRAVPGRNINGPYNNDRQAAAGPDDGAAGKPAKPKLAQTNVQPGMQLKHWVVVSRIGAGSFGETFAAVEVDWTAPPPSDDGFLVISPEAAALLRNLPPPEERFEVCIKVEQENKNVLRLEALALKKVQPCMQVVRYLGSGCTCGMNFLVMEKLGNNLAELRRRSPHGTFNIYTTLRAGISCLKAIREVHAQGLIHRDIKPSNFVTGLPGGPNWAVCYLIDFGLARRFMRSSGEIRPPRDSAGFRGTSRYASVASHMHLELGRVDDLWSLLFMLVEFATGTLPWRKYKDKEDIGRCKEESTGPHLVRNLPREFQPFLAHLQTLRYEDEPDYDYLLSLMEKAVDRRGYPPGKPVDWELDPDTMEAVAAQEEQASRQPQAQRASAADQTPVSGAKPQPGGTQVAVPDFTPQLVSKRERGGSRASSSQAAEDVMSPTRAANPSRVSVSEVELGYERRRAQRDRESNAEEPAISLGQQQEVQGSEGKAYSSSSEEDNAVPEIKRGPSGTDFSPREANSVRTQTDCSRQPAPLSPTGHPEQPVDVDEACVLPDAVQIQDGAAGTQANQSTPAVAGENNRSPVSPAQQPSSTDRKKKQKSKCSCAVM